MRQDLFDDLYDELFHEVAAEDFKPLLRKIGDVANSKTTDLQHAKNLAHTAYCKAAHEFDCAWKKAWFEAKDGVVQDHTNQRKP